MSRTVLGIAVLAAVGVLGWAAPGHAWERGHGRHGHGHGHGHHAHHGWYSPRVVVGIGPALGWGYYPGYGYGAPVYAAPYPYAYPYPYSYRAVPAPRAEPEVYVERRELEPGYWYYCESEGEYYPRVPRCPEPWVKVPPVHEDAR